MGFKVISHILQRVIIATTLILAPTLIFAQNSSQNDHQFSKTKLNLTKNISAQISVMSQPTLDDTKYFQRGGEGDDIMYRPNQGINSSAPTNELETPES